MSQIGSHLPAAVLSIPFAEPAFPASPAPASLQTSRVQGKTGVSGPSSAFVWSENQVGGNGLFCLTPVQVSVVQAGGFIWPHTHPDLSLLGALFFLILIKRLWCINGLPFNYQRLLWVRDRPARVVVPLRWFSRPKISSLDGKYPMTCAGKHLPMAKATGRQLQKTLWTPSEVCEAKGHCPDGMLKQPNVR